MKNYISQLKSTVIDVHKSVLQDLTFAASLCLLDEVLLFPHCIYCFVLINK